MAAETTLYKDQGEELSGDAQGGQRNLYLGKSGVDGNEIRKIIRKNKILIQSRQKENISTLNTKYHCKDKCKVIRGPCYPGCSSFRGVELDLLKDGF